MPHLWDLFSTTRLCALLLALLPAASPAATDRPEAPSGFDHAAEAWPGQPGRWSFRDEAGGVWTAFDAEPSSPEQAHSGRCALSFAGEENSLLIWEQAVPRGIGMVQFWVDAEARETAGAFTLQVHDGQQWVNAGWSLSENPRPGYRPHTVEIQREGLVRLRWLNTGRRGGTIRLDDVQFSAFGERLAIVQLEDQEDEDAFVSAARPPEAPTEPEAPAAEAAEAPDPEASATGELGTLGWLIRLVAPVEPPRNYVETAD